MIEITLPEEANHIWKATWRNAKYRKFYDVKFNDCISILFNDCISKIHHVWHFLDRFAEYSALLLTFCNESRLRIKRVL